MSDNETDFEIFLIVVPGLEQFLAAEAREAGFVVTKVDRSGVTLRGGWDEVWRANLTLRGATRVLVRLASFRAMHLAQLDKRASRLPWAEWLRPDVPVRVEATCRKSRIYHDGAAIQRVDNALVAAGMTVHHEAAMVIKVRIEDDLCTVSLDTSGESLHKRGLKQQVNKAPMRETLAALFLRACGYDGSQRVYDPMCGSGTFVIEAAEIAAGLLPGRARSFAFEQLASFDAERWQAMRDAAPAALSEEPRFFGSDRDAGAVRMSEANAERAGVAAMTRFALAPIGEAVAPDGEPGIVIVNPPYGGRIGNRKLLFGLYAAFGERMKTAFRGWRVGMITTDGGLAKATGLAWSDIGGTVDHGGQKVRLYQFDPARNA